MKQAKIICGRCRTYELGNPCTSCVAPFQIKNGYFWARQKALVADETGWLRPANEEEQRQGETLWRNSEPERARTKTGSVSTQNWVTDAWTNSGAYAPSKGTYNKVAKGPSQRPTGVYIPRASMTAMSLLGFGIIDTTSYVDRANCYLSYQYRRLSRAKADGNAKLYWVIVRALMKRSIALKLAFYHRGVRGWYFGRSNHKILRDLKRIGKIRWETKQKPIRQETPGLGLPECVDPVASYGISAFGGANLWTSYPATKFVRFYITKKNGKLRPIGSPETPDKIWLSMWAWFIMNWVKERLAEERQHGAIPGRGIHTAWEHILKKIINKKWIYEFDLSQAFNRILLKEVENALRWAAVPAEVASEIVRYNLAKPEPPKEGEVDPYDPELWTQFQPGTLGHVPANANRSALVSNDLYGLTQGSPTSPVLCALTLAYLKIQPEQVEGSQYLDDGVWAADNVEDIEPSRESMFPIYWEIRKNGRIYQEEMDKLSTGVEFNREKSRWVKKDGVWQGDFTFLGLTLYTNPAGQLCLTDKQGRDYTVAELLARPKLLRLYFSEVYPRIETWDWVVDTKSPMYHLLSAFRFWYVWVLRKTWSDVVIVSDMSTISANYLLKSLRDNKGTYTQALKQMNKLSKVPNPPYWDWLTWLMLTLPMWATVLAVLLRG